MSGYDAGVLKANTPDAPVSGMTIPQISVLSASPVKQANAFIVRSTWSPLLITGFAATHDPSASSRTMTPNCNAVPPNAAVANTPLVAGAPNHKVDSYERIYLFVESESSTTVFERSISFEPDRDDTVIATLSIVAAPFSPVISSTPIPVATSSVVC